MKTINKNFLCMGVLSLVAIYGVQGISISLYNEYTKSSHEMKMVSLYNKIWTEIDKKDVTQEISNYKKIADDIPERYIFGIIPTKAELSSYELPSYIPDSKNVEKEAKKLNKKTKIG